MFTQNVKSSPSPLPCAPPRPAPPDTGQPDGTPRPDTSALIRAAQHGNLAAFEELVRQHDKAVLRLALHLTGSEQDAQDAYQEAFLSAYQNLSSFRFECSFYTWIYRIVTNRCLDTLRKRRGLRASLVDEDEVLSRVADGRPAHNPERGLVAREVRTRINRALEKLSPRERTVFELRHYRHLRLRTVAQMLHTTEVNVRHALFRATQKLRGALAELR
ncbi:MAG TPA: sigma-70 family RNA polymerase sigma factor [Terriglobia bacterium]|nr:sigma-70 family RNA polymerase sigma factor [Terriglobia bacterium]